MNKPYLVRKGPEHIKPRSHCPGVRPGASRQFAAGRPGRTGTNREGFRVRTYIPGSATDQTRFGAKHSSRPVPVMLRFATVHSRCSSGGATVCPGASLYTTVLPRESAAEPRCHYGESRK